MTARIVPSQGDSESIELRINNEFIASWHKPLEGAPERVKIGIYENMCTKSYEEGKRAAMKELREFIGAK